VSELVHHFGRIRPRLVEKRRERSAERVVRD
jgi:hypothetical protein